MINQIATIGFSSLQKLLWKSSEHFGLFQTYLGNYALESLKANRDFGIIYGGQITLLGGMQIQIAAGLAYFPNGQLVAFDIQTLTLAAGSSGVSRFDRIEIAYSSVAGTTVQTTDGNNRTLDFLQTGTALINAGTAGVSPVAPSLTTGNLSLGIISIGPSQVTLGSGNIDVTDDSAFNISPLVFGNGSKIRGSRKTNSLLFSNDGVIWSAIGSGGGGGGGANWRAASTGGPIEDYTLDEKSFLFSQGLGQSVILFFKVPASFSAGKQIKMNLGHYSPSASNNFKFQATSTLVRQGTDAITSIANQRVSTNGDHLNTLASEYVQITYDLTDSVGQINGVSVNASDLIKITLARVTPAGAEDAADVAFVPSLTEVALS